MVWNNVLLSNSCERGSCTFSYASVFWRCGEESSRWRSGGQLSAAWLLGKAVRKLSFYAWGFKRSFLDDSGSQRDDLPAAR